MICCRYENAAVEYKSVLKTMLSSDGAEDTWTDGDGGRAASELAMPKRITGILSKQATQQAQPPHQHDSSMHINKLNLVVNEVLSPFYSSFLFCEIC